MFNAHWNLCIGNNSSISIEGFHEEEVEKNFEAKKVIFNHFTKID